MSVGYIVLDVETTIHASYKRKANAFDPKNWVVYVGSKVQGGKSQVERFLHPDANKGWLARLLQHNPKMLVGMEEALDLRLPALRPLRGGDFIILAGRPDKGKTTAVAQHLAHMAKQVQTMHPEGGKHILWFNNEGPGKRIMKRLIQSALGCPMSAIIKKQNAGTLWDEYTAAIGGDKFLIKVIDIHGFRSWQVEEVMRQLPPAIVVFDMIDNIRFDGELINGGQRTDQMLEAMYQWGRDLAVRFDCPVIATSQISAEGDGLPFPTLAMLKDSKTGKQGAADAIITLGAKNEKAFENLRFIGLTKNKLALEGRPKSPHAELVLDGPAGRYLEAR